MVMIPAQAIGGELMEVLNNQEMLASLGAILAQYVEDPDVLGQIQKGFENFVESGQMWALIIGLLLGYMFRAFSAY